MAKHLRRWITRVLIGWDLECRVRVTVVNGAVTVVVLVVCALVTPTKEMPLPTGLGERGWIARAIRCDSASAGSLIKCGCHDSR